MQGNPNPLAKARGDVESAPLRLRPQIRGRLESRAAEGESPVGEGGQGEWRSPGVACVGYRARTREAFTSNPKYVSSPIAQ